MTYIFCYVVKIDIYNIVMIRKKLLTLFVLGEILSSKVSSTISNFSFVNNVPSDMLYQQGK